MSGKHLIIKRVVVPILTVALMCGSTVSAFAADMSKYNINTDDYMSLEFVDSTAEVAEMNYSKTSSVSGDSITLATDISGAPVTQQTSSKVEISEDDLIKDINSSTSKATAFKDSVGSLFNTYMTGGGKYQGDLTMDSSGNYIDNATMFTAYSNGKTATKAGQVKGQLATLAAEAYSDVDANAWYADQIAIPSFFGVLNGYEDGSLKPNGAITPAEVAKVISATFEDGLGKGSTNWYDMYYKYCSRAFTYDAYSKMGGNYDVYMSQYQMTRAEIAYVIANYVDAGRGELASYISSAKAGNLGSLANFTDCGNLAQDDDGTYEKDMEIIRANWIPSRYAGALSYLVDKGVFMGNDDGTMSPLSPVKRAEVFALLNRVCQSTPSYKSGQFKSDTALGNIQTSKPSTNHDNRTESEKLHLGSWEQQNAREPMTLHWDDPTRPAAIEGDTFIMPDGTAVELHAGKAGILGEDLILQGVPLALDLGRVHVDKSSIVVKDGFQAGDHYFGWMNKNLPTGGCRYTVWNGIGLWDAQWNWIQSAYYPQYEGKTEGEKDSTGMYMWNVEMGMWSFLPA